MHKQTISACEQALCQLTVFCVIVDVKAEKDAVQMVFTSIVQS